MIKSFNVSKLNSEILKWTSQYFWRLYVFHGSVNETFELRSKVNLRPQIGDYWQMILSYVIKYHWVFINGKCYCIFLYTVI